MTNITFDSQSRAMGGVFPSSDFASANPWSPIGYHRKVAASLARAALRWPVGVWGALDILMAFGGFVAAHFLSPRFDFANAQGYSVGAASVVFAILLFCANYAMGLYDRHNFASVGRIIRSALLAAVLALALTSLAFGWLGFVRIGRLVLLNAFVVSTVGTIVLRAIARALARWGRIRLLFIGNRQKFRSLERELRRLYCGFYHRPAYLQHDLLAADRQQRLAQAIRHFDPDEIVVEDDDSIVPDILQQSSTILRSGCEIRSYSAYVEEMFRETPIETIDHRGMLGGGLRNGRCGVNLTKRVLDIALAMTGLVTSAPLMLLSLVLVKMSGRGPVIYSQVRVGRYGRLFRIYKFRTMCVDAEKDGAVWAKKTDSRITPIGRFLRMSRLDELPQLWNILCGEMSFVGPRPERPEFVAQLRQQIPYYDLRHLVPPGLTGWAQVRYRYGASVEDASRKLAFDLFYVRHYSPAFDVAICLRTAVAMAKGAR